MVSKDSTSLCRICLQDGATIPIFENTEQEDNILTKLIFCLHTDNLEDVEGYPRHICEVCNTTLETVFNFITKFRESYKVLQNGLMIVKKENHSETSNDVTELEIDIKRIKTESENDFDDGFDDLEDSLPLKVSKEVKKEPIKKGPRSQRTKTQTGNRTNKIASSILEGNFHWNGDIWW